MINFYFFIPLFFFSLSGINDAVIDTLQFHYNKSIFTTKDSNFWNPSISWTNKYIDNNPEKGLKTMKIAGIKFYYPVQLTDAFHLFKMFREICNAIAITSAVYISTYNFWFFILYVILLGVLRNSCFSLFFDKILLKKS